VRQAQQRARAKASLRMTADGKISINGAEIGIEASGPMQLSGKDVDIN
jgi:type VI secretion system secreted protein VgrG